MTNILHRIIANKRTEVAKQKQEIPQSQLEKHITDTQSRGVFQEALVNSTTGIIAEFKRRSPSRDWIFKDAKIEDIIPSYSRKGASAISILTDYDFFGGNLADLEKAAFLTDTPLLRKDFMIDEYQLYQAKLSGAHAILLIASALTIKETDFLAAKAKELGLEVLLEIHNEHELDHINHNVDIVGINNRNLTTFITDIDVSFRLGSKIPKQFIKISESGISDPQTVIDLRREGFKGFLMGENFMKTHNPGKTLYDFIQELA